MNFIKDKKIIAIILFICIFAVMIIPNTLAIYSKKVSKIIALSIENSKYTIIFDGNSETDGTTDSIECKYNKECILPPNGFTKTGYTFIGWSTSADGDVEYEDKDSVKNLTIFGTYKLYAVWNLDDNTEYPITYHYGDISFSGSNAKQATLMNAMYEVEPWPGVLFRTEGSQFEIQMNGGSGTYNKKYPFNTTNKVIIRRKSGKIYISVNDGAFAETKDHSSITNFDTPVTFGCSYTSTNTPQRYYKGTLKNMKAIIYE